MHKKASVFDFLAAYGWAIVIVIAAAIAVFYFGVLSQADVIDTRCEFPKQIICSEAPDAQFDSQTIQLTITNNLGESISNVEASSAGIANCKSGSIESELLENTATAILTLEECSLEQGLKFSDEVTIKFTTQSEQDKQLIGLIDGYAN